MRLAAYKTIGAPRACETRPRSVIKLRYVASVQSVTAACGPRASLFSRLWRFDVGVVQDDRVAEAADRAPRMAA